MIADIYGQRWVPIAERWTIRVTQKSAWQSLPGAPVTVPAARKLAYQGKVRVAEMDVAGRRYFVMRTVGVTAA